MENIRQKRKILRGEKIECKNKDKLGKKWRKANRLWKVKVKIGKTLALLMLNF